MFHFIYIQPLPLIALAIIASICLWYLINKYHKKYSKVLNIVLLVISIIGIVYCTLLRNGKGNNYYIELRPLYSFVLAKTQKEYYREMLMNVFLFVPLGLSLPFVIDINKHKYITIVLTILIGLLMSITIEYLQYYYHIGNVEIDDVIMNTIGVIVGSISYIISKRNI